MVDAVLDYRQGLYKAYYAPNEEEKKKLMKDFFTTNTPHWFSIFEERLNKVGTGFMATDKITIADFVIWDVTCTWIQHEHWRDAFNNPLEKFPKLKAHQELGMKELKTHYEKQPFYPTTIMV